MGNILGKSWAYIKKILFPRIIRQVIEAKLSFLSPLALLDIHKVVKHLEKQQIKGIFIETGCALGGSAIVIANAKTKQRHFFVYDAFGMIPSPSINDGEDAHHRYEIISSGQAKGVDDTLYYGYEQDLLNKVKENFRNFNIITEAERIHFIKGLYQNTLRIEEDVAFAHIDADWYDSVMICLHEIEPHLVSGAVMIIDDYYDWEGCKKAVDAYFKDKDDGYYFRKKSRLHIIRK